MTKTVPLTIDSRSRQNGKNSDYLHVHAHYPPSPTSAEMATWTPEQRRVYVESSVSVVFSEPYTEERFELFRPGSQFEIDLP